MDGSGWQGVYDLLAKDGYHVAVVQNPTLSLAGDAAAARLRRPRPIGELANSDGHGSGPACLFVRR